MSVSRSPARPRPGPDGRVTAAARSREVTRARLLRSGVALFAERGLNGVTTHDIARAAGVASGTFYLHFRDKAQLFNEIAEDAERRLREGIEAAVDGAPDWPTAVRAQVDALFRFAEDNRDVLRILFGTDAGPAGSDLLEHLAASIEEGRRKLIEQGQMPAELDARVLSQALVGLHARVVLWWLEDPSRASREVIVETLTRIQLHGTHPA